LQCKETDLNWRRPLVYALATHHQGGGAGVSSGFVSSTAETGCDTSRTATSNGSLSRAEPLALLETRVEHRTRPAAWQASAIPREPEIIPLRGGNFAMGSNEEISEKPVHQITIKPFAISKHPITVRRVE
jgi:formylglycine-generating enzyme required for sulfatase activity